MTAISYHYTDYRQTVNKVSAETLAIIDLAETLESRYGLPFSVSDYGTKGDGVPSGWLDNPMTAGDVKLACLEKPRNLKILTGSKGIAHDVDDPALAAEYTKRPDYANTLRIRTGRGGKRFVFAAPADVTWTKAKVDLDDGSEVMGKRSSGIVAGQHPNGNKYRVENLPMRLAPCPSDLADKLRAKMPAPRPKIVNRTPLTDADGDYYRQWAIKQLNDETAKLSRLDDGRFHELKRIANWLGMIAARPEGLLTESECMLALMSALEANGYTRKPGKGYRGAETEARFYFKSGLSDPVDLPERRTSGAVARAAHVAPDAAPPGYPDAMERVIFEHGGNAAKARNKALRALSEVYKPGDIFDLQDAADRTGFPIRFWYKVFGELALCRLIPSLDASYPSRESDENTLAQTGRKSTQTGKPAYQYRWPAYAELCEAIITEIVIPDLKWRQKRFTLDHLRKLDDEATQADVDLINDKIDHLTGQEKKDAEQRERDTAVNRARAQLTDLKSTPLPLTPAGKSWKEDYTGAVIERYNAPRVGQAPGYSDTFKQTGIAKTTAQRIEARIGYHRDERAVSVPVASDELPEPHYSSEHEGFTKYVEITDGEDFYKLLDYSEPENREYAAQKVGQGYHVALIYQQASEIRRVEAVEMPAERLSDISDCMPASVTEVTKSKAPKKKDRVLPERKRALELLHSPGYLATIPVDLDARTNKQLARLLTGKAESEVMYTEPEPNDGDESPFDIPGALVTVHDASEMADILAPKLNPDDIFNRSIARLGKRSPFYVAPVSEPDSEPLPLEQAAK